MFSFLLKNLLGGVTAGTTSASKALVVDANKRLDTLVIADGGLKLGSAGGTAINSTAAEIDAVCDISARIVTVTASTLAVAAATHGGKIVYLDRAAGCTVTLPTATGSGARYEFIVRTNISGGSIIFDAFNTAAATFIGQTISADNTAGTCDSYKASGANLLTLNGGTMGGKAGDRIVITDMETAVYAITAFTQLAGTKANPWSTTS